MPTTGRLQGNSLLNADILKLELAVAPGKLVFQLGEITGNIWMATLR